MRPPLSSDHPGRGRRVLFVTPQLPYPPFWGFNVRVYQLIRRLSENHRVSLLSFAGDEDDDLAGSLAAIAPWCEAIHTVPRARRSLRRTRARQLLSLASNASYLGGRLRSGPMQEAIDRVLATERFDVVQVESSLMAGYRFPADVTVILDEHNLEYELLERSSRAERSLPRRVYSWLEYVKFRREEQLLWQRAAGCVLTSEREADVVRALASAPPVAVVPNGVDIDHFRPDFQSGRPDSNSIVFTGLMTYRPNADGAAYFIRHVLPRIRRVRPEVTFTAVGWGGLPEALLSPRVRATGRVDDVRPFLARAGAVVVPLRMGSGTRLKVLEALAMGRPVVSTSLGCEGLHAHHGEHLLVADEPDSFAEAVLAILADVERGRELGARGRALVEASYGWDSVARRLEAFHAERVGDHGREPALAELA
ncbi:MAG: hypothetical protein AUH40_04525 [Chloroflexi bacterium 13_1_40CM_65_17]|nr:MAG: hypothetical protein AUH40_04525 [Chloroflexi bacterium 13_1_40CM_65_17]